MAADAHCMSSHLTRLASWSEAPGSQIAHLDWLENATTVAPTSPKALPNHGAFDAASQSAT